MARISGVNIPDEKRVEVSLTYIYGIGLTRSQKILKEININPDVRVKDLTDTELNNIREYIEKSYKIEGDLKREIVQNINRLKETGTYRGLRHKAGLPVRGQRTKTNSRTKRGKRVTVGSGRKKASAKT
ncbi:MAG: 30S ribosomal protein S13 [Patescibacteria group bacterium]|jgi:small subunit ribosomal protein S13|nr:30S ribosomal protein S13 [Patescibacteria group bacterium]